MRITSELFTELAINLRWYNGKINQSKNHAIFKYAPYGCSFMSGHIWRVFIQKLLYQPQKIRSGKAFL